MPNPPEEQPAKHSRLAQAYLNMKQAQNPLVAAFLSGGYLSPSELQRAYGAYVPSEQLAALEAEIRGLKDEVTKKTTKLLAVILTAAKGKEELTKTKEELQSLQTKTKEGKTKRGHSGFLLRGSGSGDRTATCQRPQERLSAGSAFMHSIAAIRADGSSTRAGDFAALSAPMEDACERLPMPSLA